MKHLFKKLTTLSLLAALLLSLIACGGMAPGGFDPAPDNKAPSNDGWSDFGDMGAAGGAPSDGSYDESAPGEPSPPPEGGNDAVPEGKENPFVSTDTTPTSTFSADVDTASYTLLRQFLQRGYTLESLQKSGVVFRSEEMINYFRYTAKSPAVGELFGTTVSFDACPWNEQNLLMYLTLQAEVPTERLANNLVFLIDVSGSMRSSNKLPLLQQSFSHLVDNLAPDDLISIVTYSGKEEVVLTACPVSEKETILNAINSLTASGSTNGEAGLERAYQIAKQHYIEGGNNRIIMASDGDLNVGISSIEDLKAYISDKKNEGIFLSVLGFGTGNYQDEKMETLANNGNGAYYYIDGMSEAEKVFSRELSSTLYTVGKDVKLQLTFNADFVSAWRLVGYENRVLDNEDFEDDTKDAGEVGAGHQVTVLYELRMVEGSTPADTDELASLSIRYKLPDEDTSKLNTYSLTAGSEEHTATDRQHISGLVMLTMLINKSSYLPDAITLNSICDHLAQGTAHPDPDQMAYRNELLELLAKLLPTTEA